MVLKQSECTGNDTISRYKSNILRGYLSFRFTCICIHLLITSMTYPQYHDCSRRQCRHLLRNFIMMIILIIKFPAIVDFLAQNTPHPVTWHYQWKIFPTCFHVLVITTCNCILSVLYKVIFGIRVIDTHPIV